MTAVHQAVVINNPPLSSLVVGCGFFGWEFAIFTSVEGFRFMCRVLGGGQG
jgi:hypothetical protein